tara:strand:+ start:297 stop:575 length:279 start_codon:yes stop_codon:yes gene_type:complete
LNYEQATRILDRTKEGQQFSPFVIDRALALTGDYEPERSSRMGEALSEESNGVWEKRSLLLVANNIARHYEAARAESSRGFTPSDEFIERAK